MMNYKLIAKIIGSLLWLEALLMVVALVTSLLHTDPVNDEDDVLAFVITICLTTGMGFVARYYGQPDSEVMNRHESYLLVTLTWIVFSFFGSLPFMFSGLIPSFTDAFFETMSGFTTTGSTVVENIDAFPSGLKLWRTMTQWIGGLGIAFFTIAILPGLVAGGGVRVFSAEATGPIRTKMHPKLSTNAKMIISVYLVLTMACATCFYLGDMSPFDATNYAMTITATGGFSTHQNALMYYDSAVIDYTAILFMFLSGVNFTLLYLTVAKRRLKNIVQDSEFRSYGMMVMGATLVITFILLVAVPEYSLFASFRHALFQVVSFLTTTGIFSDDAYAWPQITWVVLIGLTLIGGCAGSTSGGFKCIRSVMLIRLVRNELKRLVHPRAVLPLKINGNAVGSPQQVSLLVFLVVYVALCAVTYCVLIVFDSDWIDTTDAITIAVSSASNVGASLRSPLEGTTTWAGLSCMSKWCCSFLMLMGRLEILSVLVLFSPSFWKER